jgi:hypothetical protein
MRRSLIPVFSKIFSAGQLGKRDASSSFVSTRSGTCVAMALIVAATELERSWGGKACGGPVIKSVEFSMD